jgi:hypothetical protein
MELIWLRGGQTIGANNIKKYILPTGVRIDVMAERRVLKELLIVIVVGAFLWTKKTNVILYFL